MSIPLLTTQVSDLFSVSNSYIAYTWKSDTSMGFETQLKRKVSNINEMRHMEIKLLFLCTREHLKIDATKID